MLSDLRNYFERHPFLKRLVKPFYRSIVSPIQDFRRKKAFLKNADYVLCKVDEAFREAGVTYWLDFGTLLGAYRDKDFINHDIDIDVSMWLADYSNDIDSAFIACGFEKVREIKIDDGNYGFEQTYILRGVNVDIFFYTKINNKTAYYHDFIGYENLIIRKMIVRELTMPISDIGSIYFRNKEYPAPLPIEDHLMGRYGENYMIKDTEWSIEKGNQKSVRILKEKFGFEKIFIERI